jgi:TRAP-type mannitol/chloroaromatic compound transport system permease small subunit
MLRELARKIDRFQDALGRALAWLMLAMVLVVFFDVVMRYAVNRTYVMTQELEWYIFAVAYLMAGGYVMLWDEHVRVDILYSRFSPRTRAWIDFILLFVFFFPSALLIIYTTWPFFRNSLAVWEGSPDPGGIQGRWALKAVIIVAFGIMVLQGISQAIKNFYWAMGWEQREIRAKDVY